MSQLIKLKDSLSSRIQDLEYSYNIEKHPLEMKLQDTLQQIALMPINEKTEKYRQSVILNNYKEIVSISAHYDFLKSRASDSLVKIKNEIKNLSLLMGK